MMHYLRLVRILCVLRKVTNRACIYVCYDAMYSFLLVYTICEMFPFGDVSF